MTVENNRSQRRRSERRGLNKAEVQLKVIDKTVDNHKKVFMEVSGLGRTKVTKHAIDTGLAEPIRVKPYRLGWSEEKALKEFIQENSENNIIRRGSPEWTSQCLSDLRQTEH
jgi:hypothetical protein